MLSITPQKYCKAGGSYVFPDRKIFKLDIKLKYKEKRYRDSPSDEYDQVKFSSGLTYTKKDSYTINVSAGINNYDYLAVNGSDHLKFFSKLGGKRYFWDNSLMLTSSLKFETAADQRADRRKNKNDVMAGFDYTPRLPVVYKIMARAWFGQRDTKDNDERDEDFDYKYSRFYVKTAHRVAPALLTDIKFQHFKKDYLTAKLDHTGFYVRSHWKYKVLTGTVQTLSFSLTARYKEVEYSLQPDNDYNKTTLGIKGVFNRKKNWKTSASLESSFYDFNDSEKDKNRYYIRLTFEKSFLLKPLTLSVNTKYKYTDHKHANNTEEKSVRLAFKYKF